jgi:two-component system CheB/CheR fusion protein
MAKRKSSKRSGKDARPQEESQGQPPIYIAAIGASAGGLDPLKKFFSNVKPDSGIAYVVVSHLDPNHTTLLPQLLQKTAVLPVKEITDGMQIAADNVYTIAPDYQLTLIENQFHLEKRDSNKISMPINVFFQSLAENRKEQAIGIILSGTGTDGVQGIKAIKENFGVVIVQDPQTAQYEGMPSAAISTGFADQVLDPEKMPEFLIDYTSHRATRLIQSQFGKNIGVPQIKTICTLLRRRTRHDFSGYKHSTLIRRISRRIDLHRLDNINQYILFLQKNDQELDALFAELLIGVTNFFRDPPAWQVLKENVLPMITEHKPEGSDLRVWVAGASTGEEAYSMAILLAEYIDEHHLDLKPTIFATDIDATAIKKARTGRYPLTIAQDVSEERLAQFFTRQDNFFMVNRDIREMLIFAMQNMLHDPPFLKLDLVSCRNLLIYMNNDLQKKIIPLFHYTLNHSGVLFLGPAESVGEFNELFSPLDTKWKMFIRKGGEETNYPLMDFRISPPPIELRSAPSVDISQVACAELLETFVPPSVVINEQNEILFIHGRTGQFLEPPQGKVKWDIVQMARPGLKTVLPAAIHQAVSQRTTSLRRNIQIGTNGQTITINLTVRPFKSSDSAKELLIVAFEEITPPSPPHSAEEIAAGNSGTPIEQELIDTRENLQLANEELETSNEELRSMNEEYQSTNEELKSANEELETSREEMQSLNEELTTVNSELSDKISNLNEIQSEMQMFLNSLDVPTVFLDDDLNIVRFTTQAAKIFHIIDSDIGRPISHFASNLQDKSFLDDAKEVIKTLRYQEKEIKTVNEHWYLRRMLPYRTADSRICGVAVNFVDIDELKIAALELEKTRSTVRAVAAVVDEPIITLDRDFNVAMASDSFYRLFGLRAEDVEGKSFFEMDSGLIDLEELREYIKAVSISEKVKSIIVKKKLSGGEKQFHFRAERISGKNDFWSIVLRIESRECL